MSNVDHFRKMPKVNRRRLLLTAFLAFAGRKARAGLLSRGGGNQGIPPVMLPLFPQSGINMATFTQTWTINAFLPLGTENIVSGTFTIPDGQWAIGVLPPAGSLSYVWMINGAPHPSGIHTGPPTTFALDTTAYPDGTYLIYPQFIDSTAADPATYNLAPYFVQSVPFIVIIANHSTSNVSQRVPVAWTVNVEKLDSHKPDFLTWPGGTAQPLNTERPYPTTTIPASNDPKYRMATNLYCEGIHHLRCTLYDAMPRWFTTTSGGVIARQWAQGDTLPPGISIERVILQQQAMDGKRNNNFVSAYSTFVDTPDMSGMTFIDMAYGIRKTTWAGEVTTIFGVQNNRKILPLDYTGGNDTTLYSQGQINAHNNFVGTTAGNSGPAGSAPFVFAFIAGPLDLCYDPRDFNILYYATSINGHMIAKLNVATATATIYAGYHGVPGYVDGPAIGGTIAPGPKRNALFNQPRSICMAPDGTMYVTDYNNCCIRKISADGSTVSTLVGLPGVPSLDVVANNNDAWSAPGTVAFSAAYIPYPVSIRFTSTGNLVIAETVTSNIRLIDLTAQTVTRIGRAFGQTGNTGATQDNFFFIDVDTAGSLGPVDDIIASSANGRFGNSQDWCMSLDGSYAAGWPGIENGFLPQGNASLGALAVPGHYGWGAFFSKGNVGYPYAGSSPPQGRMITAGVGAMGIGVVRALQPRDPPFEYGGVGGDISSYFLGRSIYRTGTCLCFPWGERPAFSSLCGSYGAHHLGSSVVKNFDDIVATRSSRGTYLTDDAALGAYIQAGMGGSVPRPEITGNDLIALMYFIRRSSLAGSWPITILNPTLLPLGTPPVMSGIMATRLGPTSIQVHWTTSSPTIGLAAAGSSAFQVSTAKYSVWSPIESGFGTNHVVTITVPSTWSPVHFAIVAKDVVGNVIYSVDYTI